MGIIMKFIGISKKNNAQKREHNLLKPREDLGLPRDALLFLQLVMGTLSSHSVMDRCLINPFVISFISLSLSLSIYIYMNLHLHYILLPLCLIVLYCIIYIFNTGGATTSYTRTRLSLYVCMYIPRSSVLQRHVRGESDLRTIHH